MSSIRKIKAGELFDVFDGEIVYSVALECSLTGKSGVASALKTSTESCWR
ncbi:hypothetical protein OUHCRE13_01000 [Enterobacter roggenkampii]